MSMLSPLFDIIDYTEQKLNESIEVLIKSTMYMQEQIKSKKHGKNIELICKKNIIVIEQNKGKSWSEIKKDIEYNNINN